MERFKYLIIILLCLSSCRHNNPYFPTDNQSVKVDIIRFDSAIIQLDTSHIDQAIDHLYTNYPDMMYLYVENILGYEQSDTASLYDAIPKFLSDTTMHFAQINALEQSMFQDIKPLEQTLSTAFSRALQLDNEWVVPSVYLIVSGFNCTLFYTDDIIGIGGDMYLGSNLPYYNQVVYNYQLPGMNPEYIAADVITCYLRYNIPYESMNNRLLDRMIYEGKLLFIAQQLLYEQSPYLLMGYTQDQWKWCQQNERKIWFTIMDKKDLFKTESRIISSYLNEGPFTAEITQSSPGRLGSWVGWRIVESYMKHNATITLRELMMENDAEKILQHSYYKP